MYHLTICSLRLEVGRIPRHLVYLLALYVEVCVCAGMSGKPGECVSVMWLCNGGCVYVCMCVCVL